ncbi:unnamed protein product, partial [Candidula unifasciata]
MQNYRDPPPYPSHSKQTYPNQPGFRQSYSGSETSTDVSVSSNENLATTQRQEPQGEETQTSFNYHLDLGTTDGSSYSILERLGMPSRALESSAKSAGGSSSNLQVSHERTLQQNFTASTSASNTYRHSANSSPLYSQGHLTVPEWQLGSKVLRLHGTYTPQQREGTPRLGEYTSSSSRSENESLLSASSSSSSLTTVNREGGGYSSNISSLERSASGGGINGLGSGMLISPASSYQYLSPRVPPVSTYHHPHPYVNTQWIIGSDDVKLSSYSSNAGYNSTSSSVTYAQKGPGANTDTYPSHQYLNNLPPPPEYPGGSNTTPFSEKGADIRTCRSYEAMDKMDARRSQPDLRLCASSPGIFIHDVKFQSPRRSSNNSADDSDHTPIAAKTSQMVELLTEENRALREELTMSAVKVAKLQKFEMEIQKVHESHEALVKSSQKQEALWSAMRRKLEERIKELEAPRSDGVNFYFTAHGDSRIRLVEKDSMISKLLSQNQLEAENSQLTLSLTEQKARVDILENALLNAQSTILALEDEFYKKQADGNKVEQLKKTLTNLQSASEKHQQKEKELRGHLEKELEMYKSQER